MAVLARPDRNDSPGGIMIRVLLGSWALFLGMGLLMVGNGLQGSLLGVRGGLEGFSTLAMSIVMSGYFAGFLVSSYVTPTFIRRVGHVRVFAALGSAISAVLILYPAIADPVAWTILRAIIGFCFCGVYITAESWLNSATTSANRGSALSLYMLVQMVGVVAAQGILTLGDPSGYILFIVPSVLVSLAFAPILLSVTPAPAFERTKPMSFRRIWEVSPLGCVGMFLTGGIFAAQFGMSAVYASQAGLSVARIGLLISMFYVGAVACQMPIGWASDRMDRRILILGTSAVGAVGALLGAFGGGDYETLLLAAFLVGGMSNPLYALLIAYVNDAIDYEDMAAASGRLLFINGVGAIMGPLILGALMESVGPPAFWAFIAVILSALAAYAGWRMTRRAGTPASETSSYAPVFGTATPVALEAVGEDMERASGAESDARRTRPAA